MNQHKGHPLDVFSAVVQDHLLTATSALTLKDGKVPMGTEAGENCNCLSCLHVHKLNGSAWHRTQRIVYA